MNEVINNVVLTEIESKDSVFDNSILEVTPDISNTDDDVIVATDRETLVNFIIRYIQVCRSKQQFFYLLESTKETSWNI